MTKPHSFYIPHKRVVYLDDQPSLTKQSFVKESDINSIMAKWAKDPENYIPPSGRGIPRYGDFTNVESYQDCLDLVIQANESFDALPAEARAFFENDPARFLAFVEDPANASKLIELGLAHEVEPEKISGSPNGELDFALKPEVPKS